ncbi:unnamed protein product [Meloidogyne enterolobii]|uniref:Uncharacterized protein n=1 Tax=Meloidogyne enterolobii TaxID=390850 RepID=A0ACB0YC66_MELEN
MNKNKRKVNMKNYYQKNKERIMKNVKIYRQNNREIVNQNQRKYRQNKKNDQSDNNEGTSFVSPQTGDFSNLVKLSIVCEEEGNTLFNQMEEESNNGEDEQNQIEVEETNKDDIINQK